jgi:hypothetical protein
MTRARPLYQRALLSLLLGSGLATVVVHIMAVGALWFVISALIDLAAGGKRFISAQLIILWILSLAAIYGVVRFWWARRPALHDHTRSADERDRWLVIGPDGVEARKECLEPREIRTFRVHECLGAGDGRIVASIRPIPMREVGWDTLKAAFEKEVLQRAQQGAEGHAAPPGYYVHELGGAAMAARAATRSWPGRSTGRSTARAAC